jgi:catechol 2,3-dioxygenase-like lactoylglutathione lyase family enzyme
MKIGYFNRTRQLTNPEWVRAAAITAERVGFSTLWTPEHIVLVDGFSSKLDLDKTREFYEGVLGFKPVVADTIKIKEGGRIRHIFFDAGRHQLIAFMEARGVPNVPTEYDAGINRGLGVPAGFYHFAFEGIAARCATLPRMTRLCRSASRWGVLRWISTTRRSPKSPRHNRFAASTNPELSRVGDGHRAWRSERFKTG